VFHVGGKEGVLYVVDDLGKDFLLNRVVYWKLFDRSSQILGVVDWFLLLEDRGVVDIIYGIGGNRPRCLEIFPQ